MRERQRANNEKICWPIARSGANILSFFFCCENNNTNAGESIGQIKLNLLAECVVIVMFRGGGGEAGAEKKNIYSFRVSTCSRFFFHLLNV